jgi:putative transposase
MNYNKALINVKAFLPGDDEIIRIIEMCDLVPTGTWQLWTDNNGHNMVIKNNRTVTSKKTNPIVRHPVIIKDIHFKCSRKDEKLLNKFQHNIKSGTLSKTKSGNYYFSVLIDLNKIKQLNKPTNDIIGIDIGIKNFIVTSDNQVFENIKSTRNNEEKLKRLNQLLSRKQKGSKNKNKAKIKLAKFHEKITNKKENYLHHVVNQLLSENQTVVIEDLNVNGMLKNKMLAKSIQELSLNRFKTILEYKAKWYDREIIQIDRWFPSSKKCNYCGYIKNNLTLNNREWTCPSCQTLLNRDLNAAINIKNEGKHLKKIKIGDLSSNIGLSSPEYTPLEMKR